MGLLVFETRPKGGGREGNAEDVSQRNWTTEQALPASATFRKVPVLGHTATNPVPILFLHPFAEDPKRNYGFLGAPPHFSIWRFRWDPGSCPPLPPPPGPPRPAADCHGRGWGSRAAPGPRFAKSRASAAGGGTFAHGHALSADAAPGDPQLSSSSSLATLPNCSRPFNHFQL